MTILAAASAASHASGGSGSYLVALPVIIAVTIWLNRKSGLAVPVIIFFVLAGLMVTIAPRVPGSPIACLHGGKCNNNQISWVAWLVIGVPGGAAYLYKLMRNNTTEE